MTKKCILLCACMIVVAAALFAVSPGETALLEASQDESGIGAYVIVGVALFVFALLVFFLLIYRKTALKMSVNKQILSIAFTLLVLLVGGLALAIVMMQSIGEELTSIAEEDIPLTTYVTRLTEHKLIQGRRLEQILKTFYRSGSDAPELASSIVTFNGETATIRTELEDAQALVAGFLNGRQEARAAEEFRRVAAQLVVIEAARADYEEHTAVLLDAVRLGRIETIEEFEPLIAAEEEQLANALTALLEEIELFTQESALRAEMHERDALALIVVVTVVSIVLGLALSLLIARRISKPLNATIRELSSSSLQIANASAELSATSQDIANGASEQAAGIEETTASIEQLVSMIGQNADNAKHMHSLAIASSQSSSDGAGRMNELLTAMEELNDASGEIKAIIKVIDTIAFQTNILALNAAVEAARAGEAGMGFAVVADEVKNLANKSGESAQETSELVEDSLKKIESTLELARKMTELFQSMTNQSSKVTEMSQEVETASGQQSEGIEQINRAILDFDKVVQSNAGSAEESASSAEELSAQSETLNAMVESLADLVEGRKRRGNAAPRPSHPVRRYAEDARPDESPEAPRQIAAKGTLKKIVAPEEVIPFEEDEEFAHF